jgi:5-methylcytosine-specific restriction endonuclease McrA
MLEEVSGPYYPSIQHIHPQALGGGEEPENLLIAHIKCNSAEGWLISQRRRDGT